MSVEVVAVVVTYNRRALLSACLGALTSQTLPAARVLVVDNASTDGTVAMLRSEGWLDRGGIELLQLPENSGGAGGFRAGLEAALAKGADWVWMMDDDAEPHPDALEQLLRVSSDSSTIYGSLAVNGLETAWLTTLLGPDGRVASSADDLPALADVKSLPFLGFMIHRDLVQRIGLPDAAFFIAADDVEYCIRARGAGARVMIAGHSRIEHPKSRPYEVKLPGYTLTALELPPWKRYYDTRNRIFIARRHYGYRLWTQTVPGSFVRLFAALVKEPARLAQTRAFFAGLVDGLLGRGGKRHAAWGIK